VSSPGGPAPRDVCPADLLNNIPAEGSSPPWLGCQDGGLLSIARRCPLLGVHPTRPAVQVGMSSRPVSSPSRVRPAGSSSGRSCPAVWCLSVRSVAAVSSRVRRMLAIGRPRDDGQRSRVGSSRVRCGRALSLMAGSTAPSRHGYGRRCGRAWAHPGRLEVRQVRHVDRVRHAVGRPGGACRMDADSMGRPGHPGGPRSPGFAWAGCTAPPAHDVEPARPTHQTLTLTTAPQSSSSHASCRSSGLRSSEG
jgi:hypothetical protein